MYRCAAGLAGLGLQDISTDVQAGGDVRADRELAVIRATAAAR
jgi:hypothetical protein